MQEPTVAVLEMPRPDSIRPAESANDDSEQQILLETQENLDHQEVNN